MKSLLIVTLLIIASIPTVQSLPGPAAGQCDLYHHQAVAAVVGLVTAGDNEAWSTTPGCGTARSPTQVLQWVGQYSGPVILAVGASITWSGTLFSGCTISSFTTTSTPLSLAGATSVSGATITMTSNECRGVIQVAVVIPAVYTWFGTFPINIIVPSQSAYSFLCDATETTANAQDPDSASCTTPNMNNAVDITDDSTDDDILTTTGGDITVNVAENVTVNDNVTVQNNVTAGGTNGMDWFPGSIYVLVLILALAFAHMGTLHKEYVQRVFAGILFLVVGFIAIWEQFLLGFDDVPGLLVPMLGLDLLVGLYFIIYIPKYATITKGGER